jgi:hypothetical protein
MKWFFGLLLLTILIGCRGIVEREDLGENDAPRAVTLVDLPDCRLCHGYPPVSGQHFRHLFMVDAQSYPNGQITCMDCHFGSVHAKAMVGPLGDTVHQPSLAHIDPAYDNEGYAKIQSILTQWFGQNGDSTRLLPLRPMGKHANGTMDVEFAPENVAYDTLPPFAKLPLTFDKATGKCTACHGPGVGWWKYRW